MIKYDLIPEQLIYEGTITESNLFEPSPLEENIILKTHDKAYFEKLNGLTLSKSEERKTGFPLSKSLVDREILIMNGTLQCARYAYEYGVSLNIAGGTHHAYSDRGEGFCLLNDLAITANQLIAEGLASRVLIVDLDVHQGNGTAKIFQDQPDVFTFSMHGERNYPLHKEVSDLDIPVPDRTTDGEYLGLLRRHLAEVTEIFEPDFVLYQSGVDVLHSDKLGRLSLTLEGCRKRDEIIFQFCKKNIIPVAVSMGGGYSTRLSDIINAHSNTFRLAREIFF